DPQQRQPRLQVGGQEGHHGGAVREDLGGQVLGIGPHHPVVSRAWISTCVGVPSGRCHRFGSPTTSSHRPPPFTLTRLVAVIGGAPGAKIRYRVTTCSRRSSASVDDGEVAASTWT